MIRFIIEESTNSDTFVRFRYHDLISTGIRLEKGVKWVMKR